ncbi:MAG: carboxypeptidase-like regulatory domain-containing protein [Pseudomonadota bacterium]|nr:carboxypeptidase-like regulatory domain-containing protein [Pseudomonadota bacterium]
MNRPAIVAGAIFLIVAVLLALFFRGMNRSLNRATGPAAERSTSSYMRAPAAASVRSALPAPGAQQPGGPYEPTDLRWQWWNEQRRIDPTFEWKMPISFYGVVIDESGNPVEAARVRFQWNDASPAGTAYAETASDARGRFSLGGVHGKVLQVKVTKEGYRALKHRTDFEYAAFFERNYHRPEPDNPVIFRLRKMGVPEQLITRQTLYGVKPDGTRNYINLMTGAKKAGDPPVGDLAVSITRATTVTQPFDWAVVFEGVGSARLMRRFKGTER